MKELECFKLVIRGKSLMARCGAVLNSTLNSIPRYYVVGVTTVSKIGKLYCFRKVEDAQNFAQRCGYIKPWGKELAILKGIAVNPSRMRFSATSYQDILDFWENKRRRKKFHLCCQTPLPKGTVCCDSFTPTEKIFVYDFINMKWVKPEE